MKTNLRKPMLATLVTLSTASVYFAQSTQDSTTKSAKIEEVTLVGRRLNSVAQERKTPVALSTIRGSEISQKLGNREFPEIAKSTPSVYVTKTGGGYGDGRLTIRGFAQANIAVIVNGQPVNDMENGSVYWSNWSGLADIASSLQIQRGLGASKLVVPSVGGTFNVVTKANENKQGGFVKAEGASGYFQKLTASYSTGMNEKGWGSTFLLSRWSQEGVVDGTQGEGYSWFFSTAYKPSEKHQFSFTATGAPQEHETRRNTDVRGYNVDTNPEGRNYGLRPTTLQMFQKYGENYNPQYGKLHGKDFTTSPNFYHKPIATFNWDWNINDNLALSTVVYGSWGRGGGGGGLQGSIKNAAGKEMDLYKADETVDYDLIYAYNSGQTVTDRQGNTFTKAPYAGSNALFNGKQVIEVDSRGYFKNGLFRKQGVNSHNWYGAIADLSYKPGTNWSINGGLDGRTYRGMHYDIVTDLLGADAVYNNFHNKNLSQGEFITDVVKPRPIADLKNNQPVTNDNDGLVTWYGAYGQVEYSNKVVSAFVQASGSNQSYKRVDRFADYTQKETEWNDKWGYILKTGFNINFDAHHNFFANGGIISRQPMFNAVYPNNRQIYGDPANEKITSIEAGYGLKTRIVDLNINAYRTQWDDRYVSRSLTAGTKDVANYPGLVKDEAYFTNVYGLNQLHQGLEAEARVRINKFLRLKGMFSYGDWKYKGDANYDFVDQKTMQVVNTGNKLSVDGLKVGEAAQTTAGAGFEVTPFKGFSLDASWEYYDRLYAAFRPTDFDNSDKKAKGVVGLPSYNLFDLGVSYKLPLFNNTRELSFRVNVYNLLDETYIAELNSNVHADEVIPGTITAANPQGDTYTSAGRVYDGIADVNSGFFGMGRTWSASITFKF